MNLFRNSLVGFFTSALILIAAGSVSYAADKLVFDSTDHYIGACALTDKSQWTLSEPIDVTTFEVWYSWNQGETELPVKVLKDGQPFAEFIATRGNCDPYQRQWCNADFKINKTFPKGTYTTEIPEKRQCLKPGGTGAIRLYVDDEVVEKTTVEKASTTLVSTAPVVVSEDNAVQNGKDTTDTKVTGTAVNVTTAAPITSGKQESAGQGTVCSCNTAQIAGIAGGASLLVSLIVGLLFRKR